MAQTIREKAKVRQNRDEGRPTEDDVARGHLGPPADEEKGDGAGITENESLQTPRPIDPGHTA